MINFLTLINRAITDTHDFDITFLADCLNLTKVARPDSEVHGLTSEEQEGRRRAEEFIRKASKTLNLPELKSGKFLTETDIKRIIKRLKDNNSAQKLLDKLKKEEQ